MSQTCSTTYFLLGSPERSVLAANWGACCLPRRALPQWAATCWLTLMLSTDGGSSCPSCAAALPMQGCAVVHASPIMRLWPIMHLPVPLKGCATRLEAAAGAGQEERGSASDPPMGAHWSVQRRVYPWYTCLLAHKHLSH